ncbi:MAG: GntR family transcriptional regulator [Pseudomonadota bacterium]
MMTPRTLTFPKMKRDRVFEQVSNEIKKQISKGALRPGDKLPPESELARHFNVSRQTIREAMRILELSGFITIKRGVKGGPIIENTISNRVSEGLVEAIQMGPATLDDLVLAWREIEKAILIQVIKNADEGDLRALGESILNAKKKLENRTPVFKAMTTFHQNLAKASKNHIFELVLNSILAVHADFLSRLEPDLVMAKKVITMHENLLKALVKKEEKQAIAFFEKYLTHVKARFRSISSEG